MDRALSPTVTRLAANIATALFAVIMLLQLLLALGVLPITFAWGGSAPVLTIPLRLASLAAIVILGLLAYVVRNRAGLAGRQPPSRAVMVLAWVTPLFLALNTLGNFASISAGERVLFGPLSLVLTITCVLVALSRPSQLLSPSASQSAFQRVPGE